MIKKHLVSLLFFILFLPGCSTPEQLDAPEFYIVNAVYSESFELSGLAYPKATVKLYIDDNLISSVQADNWGEFIIEVSGLTEGNHVLTLSQTFKNISSEKSEVRSITIDLTPPSNEFHINEKIPTYTSDATLSFSGNAEPNSTL